MDTNNEWVQVFCEDACIRCGESLGQTFEDLAETGICAECWTEDDNED